MNTEAAEKKISNFLREKLSDTPKEGYVIGVSGGLDSATALKIASDALGPEKVTGLIMPGDPSREENMKDAKRLCKDLEISYRVMNIENCVEEVRKTASYTVSSYNAGNIRARMRMVFLYLEANEKDKLVLGTGNRTERLLGYFTKHGDGAADFMPFANLYKTDVRKLSREIGVPGRFRDKEPTAGLWSGQTDQEEIGMKYGEIDPVLKRIESGKEKGEIARETGTEPDKVERIREMVEKSEHKREGFDSPEV